VPTPLTLLDLDHGRVLLPHVTVAPRYSRAAVRGLLGRAEIAVEHGLLLADPLGCLHTVGMRFPIDIVFLDRSLVVRRVVARVPPGRIVLQPFVGRQLELAAGRAAALGIVPGRRLGLVSGPPGSALVRVGGTRSGRISTALRRIRSVGARIASDPLAELPTACLGWSSGPAPGPTPLAASRDRRRTDREGGRPWAQACSS
jgi:uncharacterized membrane protein (UPF0127 family)